MTRFSKLLLLGSLLYFCGCNKKQEAIPETLGEPRTVVVYIEANNDLKPEANKALNELERGMLKSGNEVLLVYLKNQDDTSYLLKVKPDDHPYRIASDTVASFDSAIPSDPLTVRRVLSHVKANYPSPAYGLVLWSHGTAWLPPAPSGYEPERRMGFGYDRGREFDIFDLRDALPMRFDYIIFDACSMASAEVLYEFREKTDIIIASPTEVLSDGFPYGDIVPALFGYGDAAYTAIAEGYFSHYNQLSGKYRSASISVVRVSEMEKVLTCLNEISGDKRQSGEKLVTEGIQRLDFTEGFPAPLYDFGDFVNRNFSGQQHRQINELLETCVLYKNNTPEFLGNPLLNFSGLSVHILQKTDSKATMDYYRRYEWSQRSGLTDP